MIDNLSYLVTNATHYERMIGYLRALNPACKSRAWAQQVINTCIRRAINEDTTIVLGMCAAMHSKLNAGKVHLFLDMSRDCALLPIWEEVAPFEMPLIHN